MIGLVIYLALDRVVLVVTIAVLGWLYVKLRRANEENTLDALQDNVAELWGSIHAPPEEKYKNTTVLDDGLRHSFYERMMSVALNPAETELLDDLAVKEDELEQLQTFAGWMKMALGVFVVTTVLLALRLLLW